MATSTSAFGVSRRESHDSRGFYARFTAPALSTDAAVAAAGRDIDDIVCADARSMDRVPDRSVALVVTSPPYFAGKEYEQALGEGHVPGTYLEYLQTLEDVFAECARKLEPGGRIAVNVANLGRRPYRSLSADVTAILQDKLRLLLRGEIIWQKARGSTGNCAWGSFQRPTNPVLRDVTERIVVASKGRFDRAMSAAERASRQPPLPSTSSLRRDEFMELTTDVWDMPAESASRVGHPAPYPVELPERLIHLYTYYDDLVLDPFMGSGTTAVAAVRTGRHFVGYETDASYVVLARTRVDAARASGPGGELPPAVVPAGLVMAGGAGDPLARAGRDGLAAKDVARLFIEACGFSGIAAGVRRQGGIEVSFGAVDRAGQAWLFDVCGGLTSGRAGLRRGDVLWKALGRAAVLHQAPDAPPLVLLTADVPERGTPADSALRAVCGPGNPVRAVARLFDADDRRRVSALAGASQT